MKYEIKFMLSIIGAVVSETDLPPAEQDIDWNFIYAVSVKHGVANLVAYGIAKGEYCLAPDLKNEFMNRLYEKVIIDENQNLCLSELFLAFDNNNISYMPLKGAVLKKMYPSSDMRSMSDADILIKKEEFSKINPIMLELGYEFKVESDHEFVYKKRPYMNIELHKCLIPSYNDDLYNYYGDGWNLAKKNSLTGAFTLTDEDCFVYIITHFAKHYRDAGAGIKAVIDIWLYIKKHNELDMEYITTQLEKLNIIRFAQNVMMLTKVWFENDVCDNLCENMTKFIINSGEFGNIFNSTAVKTIREYQGENIEKVKKYRYLRLLFPNLRHMKANYPTLKKKPYLLPALWIFRLTKLIFSKDKKDLKVHARLLVEQNVSELFLHMSDVGLDIYNGRKN